MSSALPWRAQPPAHYRGPRIALIHGLLAGRHMERHLLRWLREAGYADTSLYSNHLRPARIAQDLAGAEGRPLVLIGYSQGGFQALKVAQLLAKRGIDCELVVSLAAGGAGRFYPPQLGFPVRRVPGNIKRYWNYFAQGDLLGTDLVPRLNLAQAPHGQMQLENIAYPKDSGVDHFEIVRCYPPEKVLPPVRVQFQERLLEELAKLRKE